MSSALELLIMHHENMRVLYPDDNLLVLCECDGALYDTQSLALYALKSYDQVHGTDFFSSLCSDQIPKPLPDIEDMLACLNVPFGISTDIASWYRRNLWNMDGIRHAHRPLANVLKVLTCLNMQDRTRVGLCAARCGRTDEDFAGMISDLGSSHGMDLESESVFLDDAPAGHAAERVLRAWHHFREQGYRLLAVIDSQTETGQTRMVKLDRAIEVLFLQSRAVKEMRNIDVASHVIAKPGFMPWDMLNAQYRKRAPVVHAYNQPACEQRFQAAAP